MQSVVTLAETSVLDDTTSQRGSSAGPSTSSTPSTGIRAAPFHSPSRLAVIQDESASVLSSAPANPDETTRSGSTPRERRSPKLRAARSGPTPVSSTS